PEQQEHVRQLLDGGRGNDLEAAAQMVRDAFDDDGFERELQRLVGRPEADSRMQQRIGWLKGIPFRAILTTNFDGLLLGGLAGRDAYQQVLRPSDHRWWSGRFWDDSAAGPSLVKLHGDVAAEPPEAVFTRRDYRTRLYSDPAYTTFLRSVFATTTILYLGVSFTDAYLNELRSEILALLDYEGGDRPVAYALSSDVSGALSAHLLRHEGLGVISYENGPNGDHSGFDEYLETIFQHTNPTYLLGSLMHERRILWVDPRPANNAYGMQFLREAAGTARVDSDIVLEVETPADAIAALESGPVDLVITHWGHGESPAGTSNAEFLLQEIRSRDLRAPVIVFASGSHADENKRLALGLGAVAYVFRWESLFREMAEVLEPGTVTG
ncbi:MAG: SIR2 family protein, partial [Gemmatimonadetes bacterium]|nr:SIR2 family protein [Gemmatimonadota bacterium]